MTLNSFSDLCHTTNTYSDTDIKAGVLFAGASEELGEAFEEFEENSDSKAVVMEILDHIWYVTENIRSFGYTLSDAVMKFKFSNVSKFTELDVVEEFCRLNKSFKSISTTFNKMAACNGKACGHYKRYLRDDSGAWSVQRVDKVVDALVDDFITSVVAICSYGYTFEDAAGMLISKLSRRMATNKIHGEGSNR